MLKYWLWLSTRPGLGARGAWLTAQHFSGPEAAYFASPEEYRAIAGLRTIEPLLDKSLEEPEKILLDCANRNISVLTVQDAAYPQRLRNIDDPPLVLYYRGTLPDLNGPAIGVVGTRRASAYGLRQARRMGYGLSRCGAMVVSGGAKGVDTQALLGALEGGSPPIVVLGCGVDVVYPRENRRFFEDVLGYGCLLSELPPGTQPSRSTFPVRNRIISGLSLGVLVVEAPARSGSLITAGRALDQGRDVFVLPTNVGERGSEGNLQLLRDGAIPVGVAWDVLQEYAGQYEQLQEKPDQEPRVEPVLAPESAASEAPPSKKAIDKPKNQAYIERKEVEIPEDLDGDLRKLANLLKNGPLDLDDISEGMQQSAGAVMASLTLLEVKGIVQRLSVRQFGLRQAE